MNGGEKNSRRAECKVVFKPEGGGKEVKALRSEGVFL